MTTIIILNKRETVKLSLGLIKYNHMKMSRRSGGTAPPLLTSALDAG
jgi:hypothetical protein